MKRLFLIELIVLLGVGNILCAQGLPTGTTASADGFYKDIFMDSGINVTSTKDLPVSRYLQLSIEAFISATHSPDSLTIKDTILQNNMICGSDMDWNGILLYPDGAPRFRMIYMNGGKATKHGNSLTPKGRENIRAFIAGGGSYVGTCAGAYIASMGRVNKVPVVTPEYTAIWPGFAKGTKLEKSFTAMAVIPGSPLLKYADFGGDMRIDSVRHNGGCYAYYGKDGVIPEGTEPLLTYIYDTVSVNSKVRIHGEVSAWAYKKDNNTGRVVVTGSHPEAMVTGERLELMAALVSYAMDGNGAPRVKGTLENGKWRVMDKETKDALPEYTRIGDRQYHHYVVNVPKNAKKVIVDLRGIREKDDVDLSLLAKSNDFAMHSTSKIKNVAKGANKQLVIEHPAAGELYISVFCESTVSARTGKYGTEYFGRTDLLNGVPYKIMVSVE